MAGAGAPVADLSTAVISTLSPEAITRQRAEAAMSAQRDTPGFASALLGLIDAANAPVYVRQAAAVYLKNWTVRFYGEADWGAAEKEADRAQVKAGITTVMLRVPVSVRRQLSEVLAIVAEHEYPDKWQELVPALGGKLGALVAEAAGPGGHGAVGLGDWVTMQGVLETLHAVFERYPWRQRSDELYTEVIYSLQHTQAPVLLALKLLGDVLHNDAILAPMDAATRELVVGNAELVCKVFYCLSWQDLPPYFEDNMPAFMTELHRFLVYQNATIDGGGDDDEPGCVDRLVVSVLDTLDIYQAKFDEEFRPFSKEFVSETWKLLMQRTNTAINDGVVTTGIKFLTTVARSPDYAVFSNPETIAQVCVQIVIPNIELREDDVELFEDNPVEYIRRDMEGSDADTRRRGAVELVKGLCVHFEKLVNDALAAHISQMLGHQSNWKQRDTALFIVTALGWKKGTVAGGATETSNIIDVLEFFRGRVLPDLQAFGAAPAQLETPIYTADVIKYVISFRNQIPKASYSAIISSCVKLLGSSVPVVQTYAAACIERLLSVKDVVPAASNGVVANGRGNGMPSSVAMRVARIGQADIQPLLASLLPAIVASLPPARPANEYVMRLLLRVVIVAKDSMILHTQQTLDVALSILNVIIDNPANPLFNHYLFEVIAALIRFAGNESTVGTFEAVLMQPMTTILVRDVVEFGPYVFQILSQLMALHPGELPQSYAAMVPPILEPSMWDRRGYIRGMVQYLETYVMKNSKAVLASNQLRPILGVFSKLVGSKASDHLGIQLVCTVVETYEIATLRGELMDRIVSVLMVRLRAARTAKFVQNLLYFLSVVVIRFGAEALVESMNAVQPGLMHMFLSDVWMGALPSIIRANDRKVCAVAMADVACATDLCGSEQYMLLWPKMIAATVALIEGVQISTGGDVSDDDDDGPMESGESYSGGFSKLRWATPAGRGGSAGRPNVAANVDLRRHLSERLTSFTARHPGVFRPAIEGMATDTKAALQSYLAHAGGAIS